MIITIRDVLDKIEAIELLENLHDNGQLNANHFDSLIDLIGDYKEELLNKKIVK